MTKARSSHVEAALLMTPSIILPGRRLGFPSASAERLAANRPSRLSKVATMLALNALAGTALKEDSRQNNNGAAPAIRSPPDSPRHVARDRRYAPETMIHSNALRAAG